MSSIRSYSRRAGSLFAVAALVLATITPGLVPSFASAAQITNRSAELSSSSATATNVTYKLTFTPAEAAGATVIDFCENSPLINAQCDTPAGLSIASAAMTAATSVAVEDANTLVIEEGVTATETVFEITGITNPTAVAPLYLRMVTYTDLTTANAQYADSQDLGTYIDDGSLAIAITDSINVSGAVLETLTFCVSGPDGAGAPVAIADDCGGTLYPPTLKLGKTSGSVIALDSSEVSEGSLYSQISTNAANGAIVNLKSNAAGCGGLLRAGSGAGSPTNCDIAPAQNTDIEEGQAKFGAKVNPTASGVGTLLGLTGYNASTFVLNYNGTDQSTGVTSTYGDPFFSTSDEPASNKNLEITFGASVAPNTPAGLYSAELSLIATGKF